MCRRFTKEEKGVENVLPNYVSGDYAVGTERFTIIDNDRDEIDKLVLLKRSDYDIIAINSFNY